MIDLFTCVAASDWRRTWNFVKEKFDQIWFLDRVNHVKEPNWLWEWKKRRQVEMKTRWCNWIVHGCTSRPGVCWEPTHNDVISICHSNERERETCRCWHLELNIQRQEHLIGDMVLLFWKKKGMRRALALFPTFKNEIREREANGKKGKEMIELMIKRDWVSWSALHGKW